MFAADDDVNVVGDVDTAGVYCDRFYDNFDNHADNDDDMDDDDDDNGDDRCFTRSECMMMINLH